MKRKTKILLGFVLLLVVGSALGLSSPQIRTKLVFGPRCNVTDRCADMLYVDCGAMSDGPAYYIDRRFNVIGEGGGLCMLGQCSGEPKEWVSCKAELAQDK